MAKEIKRIVIQDGGREWELTASGTPAADSVGTEEIKDGSVSLQDLSPEARAATENQFATDADVKAALGL